MSCESATALTLKESGHRPTPQRLMILSAVRHTSGHVTVAQIVEQIKESYPFIDPSTVYRTLAVLKERRLVSETDMGAAEAVYEWIGQARHHHLICRVCEGVTLLEDRHLDGVSAHVRQNHGFEADFDHFAIFGVCEKCGEEAANE